MKYAIVALVVGCVTVHAELYEFGFNRVIEEIDPLNTNEVPQHLIDIAHEVGETQFRMLVDIADPAAGYAEFSFYNLGATTSLLTQIFIDEGAFDLTLQSVSQSLGVDYTVSDAPFSPPVGGPNAINPGWTPWETSTYADPNPPPQVNGINNYDGGYTGAEVLTLAMTYAINTDLLAALQTGEVRVATKIQGVEIDGTIYDVSEYLVTSIPEPASVALLVGAGSLIGVIRRRFID